MVKRTKRLEKGIESIKKEIEEHFLKLGEDITKKNKYLAEYHSKEIENNLIDAIEYKIGILGKEEEYTELIKQYKKILEEFKKRLNA